MTQLDICGIESTPPAGGGTLARDGLLAHGRVGRAGSPARRHLARRCAQGLLALGACLLMSACTESKGDALAAKRTTPPRADVSTPEHAMRSYWALIDWFHFVNESGGTASSSTQVKPQIELMSTVATGDALKSFHQYTPRRQPLERTLERVTRDADNTAQVLAHIRTMPDALPGLTPTPIELFERETGGEYRYVLRNGNDGWKVAEVWRIDGASEPRRIR